MVDSPFSVRVLTARLLLLVAVAGISGVCVGSAGAQAAKSCLPTQDGRNPCPVQLHRPEVHPLSAMADIGRQIFYDPQLSGSGKLSCASCHDPENHYAPAQETPVFLGGLALDIQGRRAVPTLTYVERRPNFSIGPDNPTSEAPPPIASSSLSAARVGKNAGNPAGAATNMVPQGGLFWDGRVDTLQEQASGPLYDPAEMASSPQRVLARISHAPYTEELRKLAGLGENATGDLLLSEAIFAVARYQIEKPAFHLYNSRFDAWLEGRARLTPLERAGYLAFNDPAKGNCAACHVDTVSGNGLPPLFTDHQYEALAAPRNAALRLTHDPSFYDLGVCDRQKDGRQTLAPYCGMFATPTLRNVATRKVFFHNGVFHTLKDVLDFYVLRDIAPEKFYPRSGQGKIAAYDDIPARYRANIDRTDAPFDRHPGDRPALDEQERRAIIAFLGTLTDR